MRSLLPLLLSFLLTPTTATLNGTSTACWGRSGGLCTCFARSSCDDGDDTHPLYSEGNPTCLDSPPIIHNGTVTEKELDQMYGTYYYATYDIGKIWMSGNNFEELPVDYFKNVSSTVSEIYLNNNGNLATIHSNLFENMPRLKYVLLHYSALTALPANLFGAAGAAVLEKFWAHNNAITSVDADTFKGVGASLKEIYMFNNNLADVASLPATVFDGLTGLKELWMMGTNDFGDGLTTELTCAHMCDMPAGVDIKMADFTLACGATCSGDDTEVFKTDTTTQCDGAVPAGCTEWDLSPAWRAGPGLLVSAVVAGVTAFALI
ncbi:hypothetical protein TL16_g07640 [Triparma laevis f. inornata]|uniref:Uncharacterized protein n=1 Tax=Triparma laevis f. inornata TaxID=1714386 RepID=A0A9W7AUP3_9STRA|nr:hypothetical protein TL16_g07640 [Triparma laevis f. inornata]